MQRNSFLGIVWLLGFALPAAGAATRTPDDADKLAGSEAAWKATTVPGPASAWDWPGWLLGRGDRGPAFEAEARNLLGSDEDLAARPERYRLITSPFGVTSGPSLDPAGRLQGAFVPRDLAAQIDGLASLGFAASLAEDPSARLLYASPQQSGLRAGVAYSPEAYDLRFGKLYQAGMTHESRWSADILRIGGSMTYARGRRDLQNGDQYSVHLGSTLQLADGIMLGLGATWNRSNVVGHFDADPSDRKRHSRAWGAVASASYETGPWTAGAYYQRAGTTQKVFAGEIEKLGAMEFALSYRTSARVRLYGAYYRCDLRYDTTLPGLRPGGEKGGVWMTGARVAL